MKNKPRFEAFTKHIEKTNLWLADLQADLQWDDRHQVYLALRAVLHALRDRMTVDEVAQLGAQLPMLVRGFYYENWQPRNRHRDERRLEAFLTRIEGELGPANNVNNGTDAQTVARAVFRLLDQRVSAGEIADVLAVLPRDVRLLWPRLTEASV